MWHKLFSAWALFHPSSLPIFGHINPYLLYYCLFQVLHHIPFNHLTQVWYRRVSYWQIDDSIDKLQGREIIYLSIWLYLVYNHCESRE